MGFTHPDVARPLPRGLVGEAHPQEWHIEPRQSKDGRRVAKDQCSVIVGRIVNPSHAQYAFPGRPIDRRFALIITRDHEPRYSPDSYC